MKIPKRIASSLINSLKGGVVPRIGLPYITVGRENEIKALLHDVDIIAEGGSSFRFIVGRSPERRLQGTRGQGLATYRELIRNMSTKTRPEGGALTLILDRWINNVLQETSDQSGLDSDAPEFPALAERKIRERIP